MTGRRARISGAAILACYRAHKSDDHHGQPAADCLTCSRYLLAILTATTPPRTPQPRADPTP